MRTILDLIKLAFIVCIGILFAKFCCYTLLYATALYVVSH